METQAYNDKLSELRRRAGIGQRTAGRKLGVTQGTISRIESGQQRASVDQLILLCELYGATVTIDVTVPIPEAGGVVNLVPK